MIPPVVKRFGAKRAVIGAALLTAAVILCYPFLPVFWWWFGLRVLQGLFCVHALCHQRGMDRDASPRALTGRASLPAIHRSSPLSFGGGPVIITFTGIDDVLPFIIGAIVLALATLPIFFVKDEAVDSEDEDPLSVIGFRRRRRSCCLRSACSPSSMPPI